MNTYKKTIIACGLTLLVFQACHATTEFDTLKVRLVKAFDALFQPQPQFTLPNFRQDNDSLAKINAFHKVITDIALFVQANNKGLVLGASANLAQASETLVNQATQLIANLKDIRERLVANRNLAGDQFASPTEATRLFIDLGNIKDKISTTNAVLVPTAQNYKSTGQQESYTLIMNALQRVGGGAAIVREELQRGGWLKK